MLTVKASVKPDQFGGVGLFADEFIPKGTLVWDETPDSIEFISVQDYFALDEAKRAEVEKYSYPVCELNQEPKRIGLILCHDDGRYMNHNDEANTGQTGAAPSDHALRDIQAGEELTSNYLDWDKDNLLEALGVTTCKAFLLGTKK